MPLNKPLKKLLKDAGFLPLPDLAGYRPQVGDVLLAERRAWLCDYADNGSIVWVEWTCRGKTVPEDAILSAIRVGFPIYRVIVAQVLARK